MFKKALIAATLALVSVSAYADSYLYRNKAVYYVKQGNQEQHVLQIIYTFPAQPNQPVYSWRTHTNFDGTPGAYSLYGKKIGQTDAHGRLVIEFPSVHHHNGLICGRYTNETVAVGSRYAKRSNSVNTIIRAGVIFSPAPAWFFKCRPNR